MCHQNVRTSNGPRGAFFRKAFVLGLALVAVGGFVPSRLAAVELAGTYDDAGIVITAAQREAGQAVSFFALLSQDFSAEAARTAALKPDKIEIRQTEIAIEVIVRDATDRVLMSGSWRAKKDYVEEPDRLSLLFPKNGNPDDGYAFSFRPAGEGRHLTLQIWHRAASLLGPTFHLEGDYVFGRR